ncbi:SDR family oxidoreductase [Rhizobium sp. TH2]|uniref:SDR family oxidoreductase n=1 Tax=Rhizobium sp. TH2 TaxID=2775403 RepID=UPI0021578B0B|nr:SDR family oxidoreductase [Rhizobium sp. TH2]UVC07882.1 SDR family oxidoreductase [Rhizobium sp. TH2]
MTSKLFDLTGRIALVTGSTQGLGLAMAEGLAVHGATVIINGRNPNRLAKVIETMQRMGIAMRGSLFDVTDRRQIDNGIESIETHVGPIDILINNAGMQHRAPLEDFPIDKWDELIRTNISSIFHVSQSVARRMIPRGRGKIINIGSVQSELARPSIAPYTMTKGAVKNLTRGMCTDWAKHGLQVNGIGPGYFKTPLNQALVDSEEFSDWLRKRTPAARWGEAEELVGAAVFLASNASSFVNGHMLYVDGGITASV